MEKDRCIVYRFGLLVMLTVLAQSKGLETNVTQPYPGNQENATKKSVDILLDSGVNRLLQGNRRIDGVQRSFDEDVTREYEDVRDDSPSSEILGEVAGKQGSKEEILDNVRPFKSHKGDYEIEDETPFGKEMNKGKNKALSLQIEAPESLDDKQQASDGSDEKNAEGAIRKTLQIYIAEEQADQQRRSNHKKRIHRIPKAGNGTIKQNIKTINNTGPVTQHNKSINVTKLNYTGSAVQDTTPAYRPKNNATKVVLENKAPNRYAVLHEALLAHNHLRLLHHVAPLQWNATLAEKAQEIADSVATDPSTFEGEPVGENIAQIWHDLPRAPLKAIGIWYSEKAHFSFSYPQLNDKVKHFTQMVWGSTNQLGIGAAPSPSGKYVIVVALYWPLGNDIHRIRDNVHRAGDVSDVYATIKETISRPRKDNDGKVV